MKNFSYKVGLNTLVIALIALTNSCQKNTDVITPSKPSSPTADYSSQITDVMRKDLPSSVLDKIMAIENTRFVPINRLSFNAKPTAEDVIKRINQLNTSTNRIGEILSLRVGSQAGARSGGEDNGDDPPHTRSVTFTSVDNAWNVFSGRLTLNYNVGADGRPVNVDFTSNVAITGFNANFGTYTQNSGATLSQSYPMSDGSTVVVFQVQGTYNPPLTSVTGLSNSWLFTGYTVFPRLSGGGAGNERNIHGYCRMEVMEEI